MTDSVREPSLAAGTSPFSVSLKFGVSSSPSPPLVTATWDEGDFCSMLVDMSPTSHVSFLRRSGPQMLVCASVSFFCLHLASCRTTHPKDRTGLFSPEVSQRLDSQLENLLKENNLPSVEVEIQVPGRGEYSFVRGMANLTAGELRRRNQPFRIASI